MRPAVPDDQLVNRVAAATTPALARLLRLPRYLIPLLSVALLLTGLALGGIAGLFLLWALAGVLAWFLAAFWPMTPVPGRILRSLLVLGVAAAGVLGLR